MSWVALNFSLGRPMGPPQAVSGGLLNRVWKLATTSGEYAVKIVNCVDGQPTFDHPTSTAVLLESMALSGGIPIARPIAAPDTGEYLVVVPGTRNSKLARVHEWVRGRMPSGPDDAAAFAGRAGTVLARLHQLATPDNAPAVSARRFPDANRWSTLGQIGDRSSAWWVARLSHVDPLIAELESLVFDSVVSATDRVPTHGDADQKNFLVTDQGELVLIDWDGARVGSAIEEIASVALQWAGVDLGPPDGEIAARLLDGYVEAGGSLGRLAPSSFAGFFADLLAWLEFNLWRSLRSHGQTRRGAEREILRVLSNLPRFADSIDDWVTLLA